MDQVGVVQAVGQPAAQDRPDQEADVGAEAVQQPAAGLGASPQGPLQGGLLFRVRHRATSLLPGSPPVLQKNLPPLNLPADTAAARAARVISCERARAPFYPPRESCPTFFCG